MPENIGVAAVPGGSFYPLTPGGESVVTNMVRLHFAKSEEMLLQAGERLLRLKEKG